MPSSQFAAAHPGHTDGLPPRPQPPVIARIEAPSPAPKWTGVTRCPFMDDTVPTDWLARAWFPPDWVETLTCGAHDPAWYDAAEWLLEVWRGHGGDIQLDKQAWVRGSYPDDKDAIDLAALGADTEGKRALLLTVVTIGEPVLVRACTGAIGEGLTARMWISGTLLEHGDFARIEPGEHAMLVETTMAKRRDWQWPGCRVAPRLTVVTQEEIDALHDWRVRRWELMRDGANSDERELLSKVEIDPSTLRGTEGFYRVGKDVNGRWWLIGPDGTPTYYRGVCAPNRGGTGGRRMKKPPLPEETVQDWTDAMKQWGFNQVGCWATLEFYDRGLGHVEMIDTYYVEPWLHTKFPDVFDPQWQANIEARCAEFCPPLREDRDFVGYYLENERSFMETMRLGVTIEANAPTYEAHEVTEVKRVVNAAEPVANPKGVGLLQYVLSLDSHLPGPARAWRFIEERYGDITKAGQAWGVKLDGPLAVNELTVNGRRLISPAYIADEEAFIRIWVQRYFEVTIGAIREYDPNHLILSMRWAGSPPQVTLEEELEWVDVVTQNNYRAEMAPRMDLTCSRMDRPLLIGECATNIDSSWYVPNPIEPPGGYASPEERQTLRNADQFDQVFAHPGIIGYTWYKWGGRKPTLDRIQALWEANYRSIPIATGAAELPVDATGPLTGHVFLALQQGIVEVEQLPAPDPKDKPSRRLTTAALYLGAVYDSNQCLEVRGNGIRGRIVSQQHDGDTYKLAFEVEMTPGLYQLNEGAGRFEITMQRNGAQFRGRFTGQWNGEAAQGDAMAYIHRPVVSTRV